VELNHNYHIYNNPVTTQKIEQNMSVVRILGSIPG